MKFCSPCQIKILKYIFYTWCSLLFVDANVDFSYDCDVCNTYLEVSIVRYIFIM